MKKFQQLLLAILSIFSFSCLLIYRHEYNKLRYVLEVLNFFGSPGGTVGSPAAACTPNVTYKRFTISENPPPAWQRISNSLYVYSAYWEKVDDKEHVKALAIGILNENLNIGCYLWYDTYPKTKKGQFGFSGVQYKSQDVKNAAKSRTKPFVFYCESELKGLVPVGVTFYKNSENQSFQGFLPVSNLPQGPPPQNTTAICVLPTSAPTYNRSTYVEFLSFHKVLGINDYIVYGSNDQYHLLSSIQRDVSSKIEMSILPWNYPFFGDVELMRVMAENDCKTKTLGLFENVLILDWNKFFVPRYLFSFNSIINELDHDRKTYKFQFSNLLFCLEYSNDPKSNVTSPLFFTKTRYSIPKVDTPVPVYRPYLRTGRMQKVSKDLIAVHQYTSCRDIKIKSGDKKSDRLDTTILRFRDGLIRSNILHTYSNMQ